MTDKQVIQLCSETRNIANATIALIDLTGKIGETNRYEAMRIASIVKIISDCNVMLSDFANEVKPEQL